MGIKVAKFGGSSLSDATQFRKVKSIINMDNERLFVVPSAPGKRNATDIKITDLLYKCARNKENLEKFEAVFSQIKNRYYDIKEQLSLDIDIAYHLDIVKNDILNGQSKQYIASRGEYLNGLLLANYLNYTFIDSATVVFFNNDGTFNGEKTYDIMSSVLSKVENGVIPGFYGSYEDGRIATFSRGGSDVTGSLVTRAVDADLYENWTDVSGFMKADPRIVENPHIIEKLSYAELRELSYMGATVLHEDSIFPVRETGIPINIKNTNRPQDKGTLILPYIDESEIKSTITGIAGKKGFTVVSVEKDLMNSELGFVRKLLSILEDLKISFEHMPTGIDSVSLVIADEELTGKKELLLNEIQNVLDPDKIEVNENMALIATVGHGMNKNIGISAQLFAGLAKNNVNIRMINQGSSEINIIVGVESDDFNNAISTIYHTFEG